MTLAFPKPKDCKKEPVAVKVMKDGREVCNMLTASGRTEYERRKRWAWDNQSHICGICKLHLNWGDTTVDHIKPRKSGGSERDDRQFNLSAVHWLCNSSRGSKRSGFYDVP